ncbi:MAG: hypothetical protein ABI237_11620 [Ginsengibacter sp.]
MTVIKKAPGKEGNNNDEKSQHKDKGKKSVPVLSLEDFKGEKTQDEALQVLANTCLINLSEKLEPPPIAMQIIWEGKPVTLFTKGNFSIITGAAKSRKSFLISLFMAAAISGRLQDLFLCEGSGINIIFDTEQAKYKVQQIAKRICNLSEKSTPENLLVYSLRTLEPSQRIDLIDHVLATIRNINFVAIDGIIDLEIDPILQAEQAQKIVMKLMQWSEIYNIHITCVLHYNKTVQTLLGHLGSFSHRKADAVIEVAKSKDDVNVSIVRAIDCREKEFEPFAFSVDPHGMPYILNNYTIEKQKAKQEPKEKKPVFLPANVDEILHKEILNAAFKVQKEQNFSECWGNIKDAVEKVACESIGDSKAKDFLRYYISESEIIKVDRPKKYAVYVLSGQKIIDFK